MGETKKHFNGRYLGMRERDNWEYATRTNASAVAVLVPVTDNDELVLVEQYRVPVESNVIELPAGLVGDLDDEEESTMTAAHRELEEETGYQAGKLSLLLVCPSSAGMSDETISIYLAENLITDRNLVKDGILNQKALKETFDQYMVVNPSIEIYLLDIEGNNFRKALRSKGSISSAKAFPMLAPTLPINT